MIRIALLISCLLLSFCVHAATFRVTDIRVEGLQRVSAGSVFAAMPIQVGDVIDSSDIRQATRALFSVGYFADIAIRADGSVLVVDVKERPAINELEITGNKAIKTEDLLSGLRDNGLAEGQIFERVTLEGVTKSLQRQYVAQGRYNASVETEVEELPRNQVKLKIKVNEGSIARIRSINIVGNTIFDDDELIDLFELKTTGWFSWLSGNDRYSKEKLTGDIETLESQYMDRGYLAFTLTSTQVTLSSDRESLYITIGIDEGDIYTVSEVELAGDPILPEEYIRRLVLVKKDSTFSQVLMTTTSEYITKRLGNEGYTFAEVKGIPERNEDEKTVKITFFIDPGKRAYVRRINFRGNTKTVDEVLRREMRQMEGAPASSARIEGSKVRLERLGFFKEVSVDTREVPGVDDQVDVEYSVEEQPSGSIGAQAGYAQGTGLILGLNYQENNWLGSGKQLGVNINTSKYQTVYSFSYNDPYFTEDGVSGGFSVYLRERDYSEINVSSYTTDSFGFDINFGYPISEIERLGFSVGYRHLEIETGGFAVQEIISSPALLNGVDRYLTQDSYLDARCAFSPSILNCGIETDEDGNVVTDENGNPILLDVDIPEDGFETLPVNGSVLSNNTPGFINENGDSFDDITLSFNWVQSTLNRGVLATRGSSQRLSFEMTLPGGDLEYYKLNYSAQYFQPLSRLFTLRLRTELGYADGYGDTTELPFFENFYSGGFGSVRGFERNSLGPQSTPAQAYSTQLTAREQVFDENGDPLKDSNGNDVLVNTSPAYVLCEDPTDLRLGLGFTSVCNPGELLSTVRDIRREDNRTFGGNVLVEGSAEIIFPLPFIKDQRMLQSAFFVDAGNVFNTNCRPSQLNCSDIDLSKLSVSAGIGLTWISSFGPLTFSIAKPIRQNELDDEKFFQFSVGNTF